MTVRAVASRDLRPEELAELRALCDAAWAGKEEAFTDLDWESASGGTHFLLEEEGRVVSHASVVERTLEVDGLALATGYVEAVATLPSHQRRGHASAVIAAVAAFIDERYELGALDTGLIPFYERLGWRPWLGPTAVRTGRGVIGTPEEDGYVMVLLTRRTPTDLDLSVRITCDWRPGDVW